MHSPLSALAEDVDPDASSSGQCQWSPSASQHVEYCVQLTFMAAGMSRRVSVSRGRVGGGRMVVVVIMVIVVVVVVRRGSRGVGSSRAVMIGALLPIAVPVITMLNASRGIGGR